MGVPYHYGLMTAYTPGRYGAGSPGIGQWRTSPAKVPYGTIDLQLIPYCIYTTYRPKADTIPQIYGTIDLELIPYRRYNVL